MRAFRSICCTVLLAATCASSASAAPVTDWNPCGYEPNPAHPNFAMADWDVDQDGIQNCLDPDYVDPAATTVGTVQPAPPAPDPQAEQPAPPASPARACGRLTWHGRPVAVSSRGAACRGARSILAGYLARGAVPRGWSCSTTSGTAKCSRGDRVEVSGRWRV